MAIRTQRPYHTVYQNRPYQKYTGPYSGAAAQAEDAIREEILNNLAWDQWVDSSKIDVAVAGSVVTLTGTVSSFAEKRAAGDDAADARGVTNVNNNLRIAERED